MKGGAVRRGAWAAALTLAVVIAWACRPLSTYQDELVRKGFPESYVDRLEDLHERHPNWIFEPLAVTDLTWKAVLDKECSPGWNLVVRSKWAPGVWKDKGYANYKPYYAKNAKAYDSGAWYQASRAAVAYFMDPRSFLNESDIFMFETLAFDAHSQTRAVVERILEGSFMHEATYDDSKRTFAELVCEVGQRLQVSPVFLAGRLKSEQGAGTVQAKGRIGDSLLSLATNAAMGRWIERSRTAFRLQAYLKSDYLPNLMTGWCIWIPVIFAVYAFPLALQIQVLGFISASWGIICREIGAY